MGVVGQERIPNATEFEAAGTVLVAGLSYRFLETPFVRVEERFSQLRLPKSSKFADVALVAAQQS